MAFWYKRRRVENTKSEKYRLGYLVDGGFDGYNECCILQFLDPKTQEIFSWRDRSGHLSYLLTDAPSEAINDLLGERVIRLEEVTKVDAIADKGVVLRKVCGQHPQEIGGSGESAFRSILQNAGYKVWEAWIRYHNTYAYDKGLVYGMPYLVFNDRIQPYETVKTNSRINSVLDKITAKVVKSDTIEYFVRLFETELPKTKMVAVDIETEPTPDDQVPDAKAAQQRIICVSFVDDKGKNIVLYLERDEVAPEDVELEGVEVVSFNNEASMLTRTFKILGQYPIVFTFNGDQFDLVYIVNRATKLGIPKKAQSIFARKYVMEAGMRKGLHIDLYRFFHNNSIKNYAFKGAYKRFGLDPISQALLGKGKIKNDKPIQLLGYTDLCRYCLNDSELTLELATFNNYVVINLIFTIARMANMTISQVNRTKISTWTKSTFYNYHRLNNILIPTSEELLARGSIQTEAKVKGKKYEGAIVREPKPGTFFNAVVLDFASLYPSEMKEQNVCYTTMNCSHEECMDNLVPYTNHHICTRKRGISSEIIGSLRDARVYFYKEEAKINPDPIARAYYSAFEQAIKVYINAAYGVFGSDYFALYCPPVAESITAFGRFHMTAIADKAVEIGIDPFYGDTDSIFLDNPTEEQIKELIDFTFNEYNLELSIDKVYRVGFFSTRKKNYLGVFEDGNLDIKGLSGKKVNIPPLMRKTFSDVCDVLSSVRTPEDVDAAKEKIVEVTLETYKKLKNKEFDIDEIAFAVTMARPIDTYKTNPQHVRAAKMLIEKGYEISAGDVIRFVKTRVKGIGVQPVQLADKRVVDIKKYIEQFQSVMDQILDPLDMEFDVYIKKHPKLMTLAYFMTPDQEESQ